MPPFSPPSASAGQCGGVPFAAARDVAPANKLAFAAYDRALQGGGDPNCCAALLRFPDGTIFWSSKMAIDADGPPAGPGCFPGSKLDTPSGQDGTSPIASLGFSLPSELIPYIVLPGGTFRANAGLALGDLAIVIYANKIAAAICGDIGHAEKIGEGSIRLHEAFYPPAPDPCLTRLAGACRSILNRSIPSDVLFFVFPGSTLPGGIALHNLESHVTERAFALFNRLRIAATPPPNVPPAPS